MKIIDFKHIKELGITPAQYVTWVKEAFLSKDTSYLPPKISIKMKDNVFFNTMPCVIPSVNKFGVKTVSRYPNRQPSLSSEILLFDQATGDMLAFMDGDQITAMRTGAVAALSVQLLQKKDATTYSFIGLGNTAIATLLCILSIIKTPITVRLFSYKDQTKQFIERFKNFGNIKFKTFNTYEDLIVGSDVIISCVTAFDAPFANDEWFKKGVLVIPVHTRGFQNCDLFFDKVYTDDKAHISDFKYYNQFKSLAEMSDLLQNKDKGRTSDTERIIAYNIGIALHDIYIASHIYESSEKTNDIVFSKPIEKFWV